jgi:6-pyruvoyltetrahydropterin/6-carboxytetrahydropterin synthase
MKVSLTRRYRFSASHRLHAPELSEGENQRVFGKCNNPFGHGHNYELEVTVRGEVNADTGLVVGLEQLDGYVAAEVLRRLENKNMNLDVPEFRNLVPTTENLALLIGQFLREKWAIGFGPGGPALVRIYLQETARNGFELLLNEGEQVAEEPLSSEAVAVS